jgi:hypothetical protein
MQSADKRGHIMKRIAVVIGIVLGIAATPTVVTASNSDSQGSGKYDLSRTWNTQLGQLYGPVKVGPSSYGYLTK